jgi:hypothetical protein
MSETKTQWMTEGDSIRQLSRCQIGDGGPEVFITGHPHYDGGTWEMEVNGCDWGLNEYAVPRGSLKQAQEYAERVTRAVMDARTAGRSQ